MTAVRYIVHDVDLAVAFYRDRLGFQLKQQFGPAMAIVTREGLTLWLAGPQASASRPMPNGRRPSQGGWSRFVLEIDNLDALIAALQEQGVTFRKRHCRRARRASDPVRGARRATRSNYSSVKVGDATGIKCRGPQPSRSAISRGPGFDQGADRSPAHAGRHRAPAGCRQAPA